MYSESECYQKEQEGTIIVKTDYRETIDEDGYKNIENLTVYMDEEDGSECSEWEEYVEICDDPTDKANCTRIDKYSEEWQAHKERIQRKKYKNSCSIATEEDCSRIVEERQQCLLDAVEQLNKFFCSSADPIWLYRKWLESMKEMEEMAEGDSDEVEGVTEEMAKDKSMPDIQKNQKRFNN